MTAGDGAENIVSFEVEHQLLQVLSGDHVPRFVAAGDLARMPYLVMEYIEGRPLQDMDRRSRSASGRRPDAEPRSRAWARPSRWRRTACTSRTRSTSTSSRAT